jgi:hypothetical protein
MVKAFIGAALAVLCLGVGYRVGQRAEAARLTALEDRAAALEDRAALIRLRIVHLQEIGDALKTEASFHGATAGR